MTPGRDVVLGVPIYGSGEHFPEALESLLAQTYSQLELVLCDDGPGDAAARVAEDASCGNKQVNYRRNERRLGLVDNWRRAFELAAELNPRAEYFGWASDHDSLHPRCVERLRDALERSPAAVMAYGRTYAFDSAGHAVREVGGFETAGVHDPRERLVQTIHGMAAGDMVYGLFRRDALDRAGVLPKVLLPDRLLLAEMSVQGEFVFVPRALRYRRITAPMTLSRQRAGTFPERTPAYARLPWWAVHTAVFTWAVGATRRAPGVKRRAGIGLAATHARHTVALAARRRGGRAREWVAGRVSATLGRAARRRGSP